MRYILMLIVINVYGHSVYNRGCEKFNSAKYQNKNITLGYVYLDAKQFKKITFNAILN